jgi:hypothetical protein
VRRQFFDRPAARKPIPGGHAKPDGGFKMLEPTEEEIQQTRNTLSDSYLTAEKRHNAAVRLAAIVGTVAAYGSDTPMTRELAQAQDTYDTLTSKFRHQTETEVI